MAPKLVHIVGDAVGYDIVDTFTKFDAIFICRSMFITRPVLPLVGALISTIKPLLWIFLKNCYFHAFVMHTNHLTPKNDFHAFPWKILLDYYEYTLTEVAYDSVDRKDSHIEEFRHFSLNYS